MESVDNTDDPAVKSFLTLSGRFLIGLAWVIFGRLGVITVPLTAYLVGREFLSNRHTTWLVVASFLSLFVLLPLLYDRIPASLRIDERVSDSSQERFVRVALWVFPPVVGVLVGTWHHDIALAFTTWLTMTFAAFLFLVVIFPGPD